VRGAEEGFEDVAREWMVPAIIPQARVGPKARAAGASQAEFAWKLPEGACTNGPFFSSTDHLFHDRVLRVTTLGGDQGDALDVTGLQLRRDRGRQSGEILERQGGAGQTSEIPHLQADAAHGQDSHRDQQARGPTARVRRLRWWDPWS
jgi:hypothetical protein